VVPLKAGHEMWFQHDGTLAHCTNVVYGYLDETFGNRWIGNGGPITWAPCSSDFDSIGFLSRGVHSKPGVQDSSGDASSTCCKNCTNSWNHPGNTKNLSKSLA
jgi:hypothetical protein